MGTAMRSGPGTTGDRRRRRSGWPTLLAILLVLAAILVVGDRVAAQIAEGEVRTQVVAALSERGVEYDTADVNVGGFPFLTQVAAGRYEEITIDLTNVGSRAARSRRHAAPAERRGPGREGGHDAS